MRFLLICKVLFTFLLALSLPLLIPLFYSLYVGDGCHWDFLIPLGTVFLLFLPTLKIKLEDLNLKEAVSVVSLVWLLFPAVVASVYILGAHIRDPIDAYFESVSGFTTTGATILNDIESLPPSVLLWRSMTQWLGGLGFIVFSFSLLPFIRVSYHVIKFESSKLVEERISPNISEVVRTVLLVYFGLTISEVLLLKLAGMDWYNAFNHAFTTVSTGGFSPKNESIKAFNSFPIELIISIFMLLGSINLAIYYRSIKSRQPWKVFTYFETRYLFLLTLLGTLLATYDLWRNSYYQNLFEDFRYALFQISSAITTTGYASDDFSKYPPFVQALMMFLTLIGGSAGSTAGGIKQVRFATLLKVFVGELKRTIHPRLIVKYSLEGRVLDINFFYGVLAFGFIYISTLTIFGILLSLGNHDLVTSFSASIACLTSFGPGLAKVGPMANFDFLYDWQKLLLSIEMVLGRLEILPVVAFFYILIFERR